MKAFEAYDDAFTIQFPNGCLISVSWDAGTYCDGGKSTVEVACFSSDARWMVFDFKTKQWHTLEYGNSEVMRDLSALEVTELMNQLSKL